MSETAPKGYQGKHAAPKARFGTRGHRNHVVGAGDMYLGLTTLEDREVVMTKRSYNELIQNDGTNTYLVHSTTPQKAQTIMEEGLKTKGTADNPNFENTVVALSGPQDPDQVANNAFNLAYTYEGGEGNIDERTAKIVFEIPKPTPDIRIGRNTFQGTHLGEADGKNIVNLGQVQPDLVGNDTLYALPADRVMGYIDFASEAAWTPNPNFEQQPPEGVQDLGDLALRNSQET